MNEELRKKCKYLKCYQGVSYKELAEYIDIRQDSFYNWLNGQYNLSFYRQQQLKKVIEDIIDFEV